MEDWTRVLLYGTFDGFTYSTDDLPRITVVLDGGEKVEVPGECVVSADEMVNKNKIKLKDVIARIKSIDLDSQEVWLNEILNELGSDYGSLKYRAGYEQGRFDGAMEREKVTVPQYVADWIEYCKTNGIALGYALYCSGQASDKKVYDWIVESLENQETFARAWIDGYEIEKEKRYEVILCNGQSLKTVYRQGRDRLDFEKVYGDIERFTRKQLEEAGFGWVFDCEGMEVKEV
uniref:DUF1642 domain-containing protein n=1 Tax=Siphoviridae sp. ctBtT10 TaxID=2827805 RepID=A0A8S5SWY0_9CAUD|nr:MAG TPA: Protein of unknown function (DUF1642) [Siphoviridae sp. ctBtT10]